MRSSYDFRKVIEQIAQQLTHDRPNTATIHSIEGRTVSLTIGGFPSIIRSVRVIGDIDSVSPGQVVDILWDKGRPVVLLGGIGENVVSGAAVRVDNSTLENSWEGMRVKSGGISLRHLNFTPVIEGHNHYDPILNAGWTVDDYGVLFNHKTRLHPDGLITLGDGTEIIKLSSSDPDYRVWVGGSAGEAAPFSVDKYGAMVSTLGEIGGWAVGPFKIESDDGKAVIDSRTPHISLGDVTYLDGEGFWVGKHGSVYRLKIGSDTRFLRWDGQDLLIQGSVRSADYVSGVSGWNIDVTGDAEFNDAVFRGEIRIGAQSYLTGAGFWVGKDGETSKLRIGDTEGNFLIWDGSNLLIQGDLKSANYIPDSSGWHIAPGGNAEFNNVTIRGAIKSAVMQYEQVMAIDGGLIAAKSAAVVALPFIAIDTNFSIFLHVPGGVNPDQVESYFALGDVVRAKSGAANFWGTVVSRTYTSDSWEVVISRMDPAWEVGFEAGVALVNYGASGDGVIEIVGRNPSIRMFTHDGSPHQGVENFLILGDLAGQFGFGSSKQGLGVGDPSRIQDYLVATEDGVQMSGEIQIGTSAFGTGTGFWVGKEGGVPKLYIGDPAGQHLTWDGQNLSIVGSINITSGSGAQNLSGLGSLATMDSVSYDEVTGSKPPADATAGATWGVNLLGIPSQLETPSGAGLYLGPEHMGYYDGGEWVTYIDKFGAFYFKGTGNAYISWSPTENKLAGHDGIYEQWYASSADGKLYAGDGVVTLGRDGISVQSTLLGLTPPAFGEYPRYRLKFRADGGDYPDFFHIQESHSWQWPTSGSVYVDFTLAMTQQLSGTPEGRYTFYAQTLNTGRTGQVASETIGTISTLGSFFKAEAWKTPTLNIYWQNYGSEWATCQYFKDVSGVVHLKGLLRHTNAAASIVIFTLPVNYRPERHRIFVQHYYGGMARVDVRSNGDVRIDSGLQEVGAYISLDGITFRAA